MAKQTLGVLTENEPDRNYMCKILSQVFSSSLDIVPVTLATVHTLAAEPAAILVNITSLAYADKYFPNSQIIFARRFLDSNHLHRLLELPEGTPVLVANKPRRIAEDLVENLQQLGINHLNYIPYWPGCDIDTTPYDTVVYAGFRSYCPENKKVYINLGYRNITPSTLAEIVKIYNLPPDFLNQFHIPVMQQLVSELYHRQDIHTQNQLLKSQLSQTLALTGTALFHLDENQQIVELNEAAARLLPAGQKGLPGHPLLPCFPELAHLAASLSEGREEKEVVYLGKKPYTLHLHFESPLQHRHCFILLTPIAASSSEKRCSHGVKKNSLPAKYHFSDILGHSPAVQKAIRLAQYYSGTDETILIFGESGTGKELFAQSIHNASRRRQSPFVAVNCAAIPDTLIESELFGYEEGAFTGARKGGKQGLFQTADNGTIFLDEIGDIPLSLQSRLLRVLEEREVMPVGSTSVIPIDVRVICATNRNLNEMVRQGTFREDLYYRLKILPLVIPPLRERVEDIPELLHSMAEGARLPAQLEHRLLHYTWPGNVRELRAFSSNLTIFYQQDIAPDQQQSLLNDLIRNFFGHRISAFTDCSEPLSQEDRLLLNSIQELTAAGRPAGRGSLLRLSPLLAAGFTEAKLKLRIRRLAESGYISVGKTRQGLRLTLLGTEALAQGEV